MDACQDMQADIQFTAKELVELKTPGGLRVYICPQCHTATTPAGVNHAFATGKQAVWDQVLIPIKEVIRLIAQRLNQEVQFGAVLFEHTATLECGQFDPANFSNEAYSNGVGVNRNNAFRAADPTAGVIRSLRTMVAAGAAANTRSDAITFMTADTMITRLGISVTSIQSFKLPQGQQHVTLPGGTIHVTRGYMDPDPMCMTRKDFVNFVVVPSGQNVPWLMVAPAFGQSNATLNPDELSVVITKHYNRMMRSHLWERLHQLAYPAFVQDRTLALQNVK